MQREPQFFKLYGSVIMLRGDGTLVKAQESFACTYRKGAYGYDDEIMSVIAEGKPATSAEFHRTLQKFLERIAAVSGYDVNLHLIPEAEVIEL